MHMCARCPRVLGRSCCEPDDDQGLCTLSAGDVTRVQAEVRRAASFFVGFEALGPEAAHAHAQLRPANRHAAPMGVRRHLRAVNGACVFHRSDVGCTLSVDARPLACRLYPFEVDALDRLRVEPAGRCLAEETSDGLKGLLEAMGHTEESVRVLHAQHCQELADDARALGK